ncbi:unnamed protein product [Paramecium sonneborni]|uniref:Transmembrane protein n=1 Tax=Paramecium sonneborni TaxID=65129 RepID=A0A8S1N448_9CILI|nr:unnamed protein product [Paramecium sonneborni]
MSQLQQYNKIQLVEQEGMIVQQELLLEEQCWNSLYMEHNYRSSILFKQNIQFENWPKNLTPSNCYKCCKQYYYLLLYEEIFNLLFFLLIFSQLYMNINKYLVLLEQIKLYQQNFQTIIIIYFISQMYFMCRQKTCQSQAYCYCIQQYQLFRLNISYIFRYFQKLIQFLKHKLWFQYELIFAEEIKPLIILNFEYFLYL